MNEKEDKIVSYANAIIKLLQGVIYDDSKKLWNELLNYQAQIQNYFEQIGVNLILNEKDGYAYLSQPENTDNTIPRLTRKYTISYELTILLVILRDFLEEHDAKPTDTQKCFVSEREIKERAELFFKNKANKTKLLNKIVANINKAVDYKFLKPLAEKETYEEKRFEILRIIKSKISLSKLEEIKQKLQELSNKTENEHIS